MSTDVRKRWKPLDSGNATSVPPAASRLPCHCPAARAPRVRDPPPPNRLPQPPQPRAGPAGPPGRGEGRAAPLLLWTPGVAEEALSLPRGTQVRAPGGLWSPVPSHRGAGPGRAEGAGSLGSGIVFLVPGQLGGWRPGGGGAGRGRCGRKGKRGAPAPTQSHHTPPPRCGFAAATSDLFANMPPANREKNTSIQSSDPN